jgi:hypothetical protein
MAGGIEGIFNSTDFGRTWASFSLPFPTPYVRTLAVGTSATRSDSRDIFAGTFAYAGMYVSTDQGLSWAAANNGLTSNIVWAIASHGSNVFAGTDSGVFLSTNSGQNWKPVNNDLPPSPVYSILVSFPYLLIGNTMGAWRRPLSEMIPQDNPFPERFALWQNYPNPFNPTTTITFDLPTQADVKLTIFDALGQEVTKLFSGTLHPGTHKQVWNAAGSATGVYFVYFQANGYRITRRLIFLK